MARIQFSQLSVAIASLASAWERSPLAARFDLARAERAAIRRHARHYGITGKRMPRHAMAIGSKPALKYAARIAAGKIPADQILRNPVFAKTA